MRRVQIGVNRRGDAGQAFKQGRRGSVEVLIRNAMDTPVADGTQRLPLPLSDDAGERDAIAGSAPGK